MKGLKWHMVILFLTIILLFSGTTVIGVYKGANVSLTVNKLNYQTIDETCSDSFYFVHITDTHVMHKDFDKDESTKKIFETVIEKINSFSNKPAFVVLTGDLVEWGGSSNSGALHYQTLVGCFHEKDNQFYTDADYSIPVYTTPGNHDYMWENSLKNYHTYVDKNYIDDEDRYIVAYGDVSLFFMDSGSSYISEPWDWPLVLGNGLYDDDIEWLEEKLGICKSNHKIILMHHPAVNKRNEFGRMEDVIARNREEFINLCEDYNVELVLAGHTHNSRVFDSDEVLYEDYPMNCSQYPTLYVQSDDCKQGCHYRIIRVEGDDIWIEESIKIGIRPKHVNLDDEKSHRFRSNILKRLQLIDLFARYILRDTKCYI